VPTKLVMTEYHHLVMLGYCWSSSVLLTS